MMRLKIEKVLKLSVTLDTDEIIVLDDGRIVERGTHDELMSNNSMYKELYLSQAKKYKC